MKKLVTSKKLILVVVIIFASILFYVVLISKVYKTDYSNPSNDNVVVDKTNKVIQIGPKNIQFSIETASTDASREQGLSGRLELEQSHGMLFVFDKPTNACFWMKDMKFNLDIIWFDSDMKLINIKKEATPASYPESYCSRQDAKYVLEIKDGSVDRYNLKLDDKLVQL